MVIAAGLELVGVGESLNTAGAQDLRPEDRSSGTTESPNDSSDIKTARELTVDERKRRWTIMTITVGGILAFHNDAIGFLAGMVCHRSFKLQDEMRARAVRREGQIRLGNEEPRRDVEASSAPAQ